MTVYQNIRGQDQIIHNLKDISQMYSTLCFNTNTDHSVKTFSIDAMVHNIKN